MRTPPKPRGPSTFQGFLRIAERGAPFTCVDGRAFIRVPAQSYGGFHTLPVRSRAFRQRFFAQCFSEFDAIPSAQAFGAILHHLEAQAAREPERCEIRVPYRIDSRGISPLPKKFSSTSPTPKGSSSKSPPRAGPSG
jgi:hypothetical protein